MSHLTEKAVGELLDNKFYIPSYQRGYRWTGRQVNDLLDDIWEFSKTCKGDEWYCLQPVVVKQKEDTEEIWEVIDGQQRLTTIYLIVHFINEMWEGKDKNKEIDLSYQTREKSSCFLKNIKIVENSNQNWHVESSKSENSDLFSLDANIDFYHISEAYKHIKEWSDNKKNSKDFDKDKLKSTFLKSTKVIWYEVVDKDAIEIFTRINTGKIPLTNAELIKALFLNSSNFPNSEEEIRLRQLEIASEWDRMEYSLQNDELWYFINNSENSLSTRIEYIFEIMKSIEGEQDGNDPYATFRFFSKKFKSNNISNNITKIDENWKEIKRIFQTIIEWFSDRELYYKIGYLIFTGEKTKELLKEVKNKQKQEFKKYLDDKIAKKVKYDNWEELEYGKNNREIKNILLLHNIHTMLLNENEASRFPFDRFKKEKWDIEHIHAIASEMPENKEHRIDWLKNSNKYIIDDEKLASSIHGFVASYDEKMDENSDSFDNLANRVLKYYSDKSDIKIDENDLSNNLSNLVLLDSGTNRGYKNAVFPVKRETIIKKEKEGTFIPICTKNVFLKYYTSNPRQITFWDESDRKNYLNNLKETLKHYGYNQE